MKIIMTALFISISLFNCNGKLSFALADMERDSVCGFPYKLTELFTLTVSKFREGLCEIKGEEWGRKNLVNRIRRAQFKVDMNGNLRVYGSSKDNGEEFLLAMKSVLDLLAERNDTLLFDLNPLTADKFFSDSVYRDQLVEEYLKYFPGTNLLDVDLRFGDFAPAENDSVFHIYIPILPEIFDYETEMEYKGKCEELGLKYMSSYKDNADERDKDLFYHYMRLSDKRLLEGSYKYRQYVLPISYEAKEENGCPE